MSGSGQQGITTSQLPAGSYRPGTGARSILAAKGRAMQGDINYGLGPPQRDPNSIPGRTPYPAGSTNPNDRMMQGGYGTGFPDAQQQPMDYSGGSKVGNGQGPVQWGGGNPWFNNPTPSSGVDRIYMPTGGAGGPRYGGGYAGTPGMGGSQGGSQGGKGGGSSGYGTSNRPPSPYSGGNVGGMGGPTDSGGSSGKGGSGQPAFTKGPGLGPMADPNAGMLGPPQQQPGSTSTNPAQMTSAQWAEKMARENPNLQGQYVDMLDYFKPGANGEMAGMPILNGWDQLQGKQGFTGFKDGLFFQNGRDVIGQISGNDPFNADNRQRLGSQGFRVAIPKLGAGMVNGVDPRTWGFGG